jgi:hypothetical protein
MRFLISLLWEYFKWRWIWRNLVKIWAWCKTSFYDIFNRSGSRLEWTDTQKQLKQHFLKFHLMKICYRLVISALCSWHIQGLDFRDENVQNCASLSPSILVQKQSYWYQLRPVLNTVATEYCTGRVIILHCVIFNSLPSELEPYRWHRNSVEVRKVQCVLINLVIAYLTMLSISLTKYRRMIGQLMNDALKTRLKEAVRACFGRLSLH